jgi:hypothetical protein
MIEYIPKPSYVWPTKGKDGHWYVGNRRMIMRTIPHEVVNGTIKVKPKRKDNEDKQ